MNRVIFIGRLTADMENQTSQDGKPFSRFRLAVGRAYKREGEPEADFFSCSAFGRLAEVFARLQIKKGTKLMVEGEIRNDNYTDKAGVKRYENRVIINSFEFCEAKGDDTDPQDAPTSPVNGPTSDFEPIPEESTADAIPWIF